MDLCIDEWMNDKPVVSDEDAFDRLLEDDASRDFRPLVRRIPVTQERQVLLDPQRRDLVLDGLENGVTQLALSPARKRDPEKTQQSFQEVIST